MKIRLLDRNGDHLCDWTIQHSPLPAQAPEKYPNMVIWPGAVGKDDRFFAIDPNTLPSFTRAGRTRPANEPPTWEEPPIATYHECDEPFQIGTL